MKLTLFTSFGVYNEYAFHLKIDFNLQPMPEIEHNAEGFHYIVYWKRKISGREWDFEEVHNWRTNSFMVPNQPTFQEYLVKVVAINKKGEANVAPKEVIGYSGEDGKCFSKPFSRSIIIVSLFEDLLTVGRNYYYLRQNVIK